MDRVTFGKTARHAFARIGNFRTTNKRKFCHKKETKIRRENHENVSISSCQNWTVTRLIRTQFSVFEELFALLTKKVTTFLREGVVVFSGIYLAPIN